MICQNLGVPWYLRHPHGRYPCHSDFPASGFETFYCFGSQLLLLKRKKRTENINMEDFKSSVKKLKHCEMPPEMPLMPNFARNSILSASFRSVRSSSLSAITKYGSVIESSSFKSLNSRFSCNFTKYCTDFFHFEAKFVPDQSRQLFDDFLSVSYTYVYFPKTRLVLNIVAHKT